MLYTAACSDCYEEAYAEEQFSNTCLLHYIGAAISSTRALSPDYINVSDLLAPSPWAPVVHCTVVWTFREGSLGYDDHVTMDWG